MHDCKGLRVEDIEAIFDRVIYRLGNRLRQVLMDAGPSNYERDWDDYSDAIRVMDFAADGTDAFRNDRARRVLRSIDLPYSNTVAQFFEADDQELLPREISKRRPVVQRIGFKLHWEA